MKCFYCGHNEFGRDISCNLYPRQEYVPQHRFFGYYNKLNEIPSISCNNCGNVINVVNTDKEQIIIILLKSKLDKEQFKVAKKLVNRHYNRRPHNGGLYLKRYSVYQAVNKIIKCL
tara:strand:- start:3819 stop:4166 length:348 start_codon:yes stop_codon:yes gene_type:complete